MVKYLLLPTENVQRFGRIREDSGGFGRIREGGAEFDFKLNPTIGSIMPYIDGPVPEWVKDGLIFLI